MEQPVPEKAMVGPWEGEWVSEETGHRGRLRCLVRELGEQSWEARFHAKYTLWKILPLSYGYTVALEGGRVDGRVEFAGKEDLGKLAGGIYEYQGHATAEKFDATYRCKYDHGTFSMTRPAGGGKP